MRLIGHLPAEASARLFADYLYAEGIETNLEQDNEAGWGIWIHDEDRVLQAVALFAEFRTSPSDPKFQQKAAEAPSLRKEKQKGDQNFRKRFHDHRDVFKPLSSQGFGPVTIALIAISVLVYIPSRVADNISFLGWLVISNEFDPGLVEIRHGQLWRLITPIFIHSTVLHILFNMLWLKDLGGMVESILGSRFLLLFVAISAAASNVGQYFWAGPSFGGMSGVIYGLLGYVWIRGKFDPGSGLFLHQTTVTMMLVWFVVCLVGIIPRVANASHGVGLLVGIAWGYMASQRRR